MSKTIHFGENTIKYIPNVSKIFEFEQVPANELKPMNIKIGRPHEDLPLFLL